MSSCDASFGSSGQSFAHLSSDNRLHLWDVASKKLKKSYVEKNHLTHSFTCYNWKSSKDTSGTFVVGYSDGIIVVWDLNRGVVAQTIGNAKESQPPTDVVLARDGKSVYVSTDLNNIVRYDITNGNQISTIKAGKKGVQKLAMNPKVDVIAAAGSSIKLIDIASGQKRKLEASFAGGITTLTFTPCGRFLAASSARTRELLVFDTRAEAGSDAPVYVLPVRGVLTAVEARTSTNKETMQFLCVFEDSGAYIFELDVNYSKNESNGVNSVRSETNIVSVEPIVAGCFGSAGQPEAPGVSLVLGAKSSPVFKYVDISANEREIVLQELSQKSATVNGSTSKNGVESALFAPEVLGPHEMGGVKRPIVSTENSEQHKRSKTDNGNMITASGDSSELTLEARLESLSNSLATLEDRAETKKSDKAGVLLPAPTSDSMVTLIDQALQSGDDGLLEQCLSCADGDIVEATARRLPTSRVVMFLRKLVAKFEKRPSRGVLLTQWLSALLRHHTAYLVTVPDLSYQLAGLSQMLEQRLGSYSKLSSLAGRLDLLMSQVSYRSDDLAAEVPNGFRGMAEIAPMAVFQEE